MCLCLRERRGEGRGGVHRERAVGMMEEVLLVRLYDLHAK